MGNTIKIIIAGGRDFNDYEMLKNYCDTALNNLTKVLFNVEIASGGCKGTDSLGERYATEKGYSIKRFLPDWNTYGKMAGPMRNKQMAEYADGLIAFWDGESRGTRNMILQAKERKLKVEIIKYNMSRQKIF